MHPVVRSGQEGQKIVEHPAYSSTCCQLLKYLYR